MMTTALQECPLACPCHCPCPLPESNEAWENTWGFTEPCPDDYLEPGQVITHRSRNPRQEKYLLINMTVSSYPEDSSTNPK